MVEPLCHWREATLWDRQFSEAFIVSATFIVTSANAPIYAAIVTAIAALLGVLIGGFLQYFISERQYRRKRTKVLKIVALFISEISSVLHEFNDENKLYIILEINAKLPSFMEHQLGILHSDISEFDPQIAIYILWIRQASTNVNSYLKQMRKLMSEDQTHRSLPHLLQMALVDIKSAIEFSNKVLIRSFNVSDRGTRAALLQTSSFQQLYNDKMSGKGSFAKGLIKLGLRQI